jgi:hypothetical protein
MPAFRCRWDARRGAMQLRAVFERIKLDIAMFEAAPFTRLNELKHLRSTHQLDGSLFWVPIGGPVERAVAA